jgi:hypothetical protein
VTAYTATWLIILVSIQERHIAEGTFCGFSQSPYRNWGTHGPLGFATGYIPVNEIWFHFQQGQEIFLFFIILHSIQTGHFSLDRKKEVLANLLISKKFLVVLLLYTNLPLPPIHT